MMSKHLIMDGVDDQVKVPVGVAHDRIVIDAFVNPSNATGARVIMTDARVPLPIVNGNISIGTVYSGVRVDGAIVSSGSPFIFGKRILIDIALRTSSESDVIILPSVSGILYDVKVYNGSTLQAHYDMSTGTVNDQSGRRNHGTLIGGTWEET